MKIIDTSAGAEFSSIRRQWEMFCLLDRILFSGSHFIERLDKYPDIHTTVVDLSGHSKIEQFSLIVESVHPIYEYDNIYILQVKDTILFFVKARSDVGVEQIFKHAIFNMLNNLTEEEFKNLSYRVSVFDKWVKSMASADAESILRKFKDNE